MSEAIDYEALAAECDELSNVDDRFAKMAAALRQAARAEAQNGVMRDLLRGYADWHSTDCPAARGGVCSCSSRAAASFLARIEEETDE